MIYTMDSQGKVIDHIYDCPVRIFFIECLINKNIKALVTEGQPSDQDIKKAWEQLLYEYQNSSHEKRYDTAINICKELERERCRYDLIKLYVTILFYQYDPACIKKLQEYGYGKYKFNYEDQDEYKKDLYSILSSSKTIQVSINQLQKQYEDIIKEYDSTKKELTMEGFYALLAQIAEFRKCDMDIDSTTVAMFNAIKSRMDEYIAMQKRK